MPARDLEGQMDCNIVSGMVEWVELRRMMEINRTRCHSSIAELALSFASAQFVVGFLKISLKCERKDGTSNYFPTPNIRGEIAL